MSKITTQERDEARDRLRELLSPGDTVSYYLSHISRSGMSRSITVLIPSTDHNGKPCIQNITWLVSRAIGWPIDQRHGGVKVSGCGMDMGFHLVHTLGWRLWPDGTPEPHSTRNGKPDTDGGYALRGSWV